MYHLRYAKYFNVRYKRFIFAKNFRVKSIVLIKKQEL